MDLNSLRAIPPWEWPDEATEVFLTTLRDTRAADADRLAAAELAGDYVVINDELADALLTILHSRTEPDALRCAAAISLGPALEHADMVGFDDPDDVLITEPTFHRIRATLGKLYEDVDIPRDVRRCILEASARAAEDWHLDAVRTAYASDDEAWRLTAVFCMRFVRGCDTQILEALDSGNPEIAYEAVCAAGNWEVDAAWPHVRALLQSAATAKPLRLAAIEAAACIRPEDAAEMLADLSDADDEDIAAAAAEALAMAAGLADEDDEDDDFAR